MSDFAKLQALLHDLHIAYQLQNDEADSATLTVCPDGQAVLGPAGSQVVYTFQNNKLLSMEILMAAS